MGQQTQDIQPQTDSPVEEEPIIDAKIILNEQKKLRELIRHVRHVQDACIKMAEVLIERGESEFARTLVANAFVHDQTKFRGIEWDAIGCRNGESDEHDKQLAITQHQRTNLHHPEYWQTIHKMPEIYVAEMVADWWARSVEFGTDLKKWIETTAMPKYGFTKNHKIWRTIRKYVDILLERPFD